MPHRAAVARPRYPRSMVAPSAETPWRALTPEDVAAFLGNGADDAGARWWLSGGVALDRFVGAPIRERENIDVSTIPADLEAIIAALPAGLSAWVWRADDEPLVAWGDVDRESDIQRVLVHDDALGAWVLRVNVEDGAPRAWMYRRDPRLQVPWDAAVRDLDGIPTGAPEIQLVWKALRPRPEDDIDKDAVLPSLSPEAVSLFETALLRIHPHSTWSIHVRSPLFPARPSWNRRPGAES